MNKVFTRLIVFGLLTFEILIQTVNAQSYCNPLNLSYRISQNQPSLHEASDPTAVLYKDEYYLFATNAGGYWHSTDLLNWKLIQTADLPLENFAPTAVVIGDWLYFFTSLSNKIYRSNNPANGKWEVYNDSFALSMVSDFCVFADTDGRVYCYYGCTNNEGVMSRELDVKNKLNPKGVPKICALKNTTGQGWKRPADKLKKASVPGVSGSWMNKYNGKYYYQFTEPDTEFNTYNEVVYVSDHPFGPFAYVEHNPFVSKPQGFVSAAGKGSTFTDKYGNWWHVTTLISTGNQQGESRLGLFPAAFDAEDNLVTYTDFGDYPIQIPDHKYTDINELRPGWSLLSYLKKAEVSAGFIKNSVDDALDENIATICTAQFTNKEEWMCVDLGASCSINAVQVNFAENKTKSSEPNNLSGHPYLIQYSSDKQTWKTFIDRSTSTDDLLHPFDVINTPVQARYVKLIFQRVSEGNLAVSGFRIFGVGNGQQPTIVKSFLAQRDRNDPSKIKLSWWGKQKDATGYNIHYGTQKDKLYHSYQVYNNDPVVFHGLDKNKTYWFSIDAFGENGITPSLIHSSH
ncbi:MAG: family 43 glycosylhydrolase [Candidatus Saccharibacteria bacterium]